MDVNGERRPFGVFGDREWILADPQVSPERTAQLNGQALSERSDDDSWGAGGAALGETSGPVGVTAASSSDSDGPAGLS